MFYEAVGFLVLVSVIISLIRLIRGPTAYDRMIAIDAISSLMIILIVLLAFIISDVMLIDIAVLYAILNFIGTLAVSKYFLKERMWKE
ncbi:MAG: cation:proton antiporter [Candidatus Aenigmarchaeota archaeon]|nr:cation:proton antiporter [Candidatus Aenigmarchaeota archaeon]